MLQCCGGGEGPGRVENLVMGSLVYAPGTQNLDLKRAKKMKQVGKES